MLPKSSRITRQQFLKISRSGRVFSAETVSFRTGRFSWERGASPQKPRFAFVVSKKAAKTAVLRNVLRRRGYRTIASVLNDIPSDVWGIFFVKKEAREDMRRFEQDILTLLKRSRVLLDHT